MNLGPLVVDFDGFELSSEDTEVLKHPLVGGVILFAKNYESRNQLKLLVDQIKKINKDREVLITVDHEGGRVQRFLNGFSKLPSQGLIGNTIDDEKINAKSMNSALVNAFFLGRTIGSELAGVGVDLSFTPVLDINYGRSEIIGDRAFSNNPENVCSLAMSLILGLKGEGLSNCAKHFPGHGWVVEDTHTHEALDKRTYEEILNVDVLPYKILIKECNLLSSVMASHVIYSRCDPNPASLSEFWLKKTLRGELNFQGIIFCDDLSMHSVKNNSEILDLVDRAFVAGCDSLIVCNDRSSIMRILDNYDLKSVPKNLRSLQLLKRKP